MSVRSANRLWMAWSLVLLAATLGVLWFATRVAPGGDGQETLAPLRSGIEDLEAAKSLIEPLAAQLEANADQVSRIAQRQLPRPPFGLVEPPFVQDMREREESLLTALAGVGDQLRESKEALIELQRQVNTIESSMQSDLGRTGQEIGLLEEKSDRKRLVSSLAFAFLSALAALSVLVLAWRADRRRLLIDRAEESV